MNSEDELLEGLRAARAEQVRKLLHDGSPESLVRARELVCATIFSAEEHNAFLREISGRQKAADPDNESEQGGYGPYDFIPR